MSKWLIVSLHEWKWWLGLTVLTLQHVKPNAHTYTHACMQTRNTEHWGSQVLTLPWYLILSYCCWRKAGLWVPLWVVLLLPCQTEYLAVTSHPPLPTGDRTSWLCYSPSLHLGHFLSALSLSSSSSSSSGSPVRTKHIRSGQSTNSAPCLHLQFILPLTGQVNVRLSEFLSEFLSFPLNWRAGTPLTRHTTGQKKRSVSWVGLENFAKSPGLPTCNHCAAI